MRLKNISWVLLASMLGVSCAAPVKRHELQNQAEMMQIVEYSIEDIIGMGRHQEAIIALEQYAIRHFDGQTTDDSDYIASLYQQIGDKLLASSELEKAIQVYQKALELSQSHLISLWHIGEAYLSLGDSVKAEEMHKKAIEINPKNPESWRHLAQTYDTMQRYDEAANCWRRIIELALSGDSEVASVIKGMFNQSDGYVEMYGLSTYFFLIQSLRDSGRVDEALDAANKGIKRSKGNDVSLFAIRAEILEALGRNKDALDDYKRVSQLNPEYGASYKGNIQRLESALLEGK